MADLPTARASDAERDRVVGLLREHCVEGRLTLEEFTERMSRALEARTQGDLEPVLKDLPSVAAQLPELRQRKGRRWIVAFMSGSEAKGRWRVGEQTTAVAIMGGCKLDLRRAEINGPEITVSAWALWGGIDIILPEGIDVEVSGFSLMGGRSVKMRDVPVVPGSPLVKVRAYPIMGGVTVRTRQTGRDDPIAAGLSMAQDALDMIYQRQSARSAEKQERSAERQERKDARHAERSDVPSPAPPTDVPVRPEVTEDGTVTILFTDVSDFSGMIERLGDRFVHELLASHRESVRDLASRNGGRMVKAQGDGFMLAFAGVARALRCAGAIQQQLSQNAAQNPENAFHAHMGIHTGEALMEGQDYVGHTVIVACRLAESAQPDEVLVSAVSQQLVSRNGEFTFRPAREIALKGLKDIELAAPFEWANKV